VGKQSKGRRLADNEAVAVGRMLRGSPQKFNLVAQTIRGKPVEKALTALSFSRRAAARDVKKVLESAVANAENNHSKLLKPFSRVRIVVREVEES